MSPDAETEALLTAWQRTVVEGITAWCDAQDIVWERQLVRTFGRTRAETITVQLTIDDVTLAVGAENMIASSGPNAREWIGHPDDAASMIRQITIWLDGA